MNVQQCMWTEENLTDAMQLLLAADSIEKVETPESSYVVASGITYTDELYLKALERLETTDRVERVRTDKERSEYRITRH